MDRMLHRELERLHPFTVPPDHRLARDSAALAAPDRTVTADLDRFHWTAIGMESHLEGEFVEFRALPVGDDSPSLRAALERLDAIARVEPRNAIGEAEFTDALAQSFTALHPGEKPVWNQPAARLGGSPDA